MRETAQLIELTDFSPGIFSDYAYGSGEGITETQEGSIFVGNGAATIENTARCVADPTGALVPLPKLVQGKTQDILPVADNAASNYTSGLHASFLMDGYVRGDMFTYDDQDAVVPDRAGVYVMYGMPFQTADDGAAFFWTTIAQLHRLWEGATSSDQHDLMWARGVTAQAATAANTQLGCGNFSSFRVRNSVEDATTIDCVAWVARVAPGYDTNSGLLDSGTIGATELALTNYETWTNSVYPGSHGRVLGIFPDPADGTGQESGFLGGTHLGTTDPAMTDACYLVSHQGRMVSTTRSLKQTGGDGATDDYGVISESVTYSPIQDFYGELGFGCFETAQFGEEKPFRSGVVASITADEILFIRDREGAVLVRGDLDNPTVVQLPYVESTHGAHSLPAKTNFGLVYGTSNGVYVWEGGESSRLISPQLNGWFWNHDVTLNYLGNRGRFGWWNPYVVVPNNFIYDSRSNGWWRIDSVANTNVSCSVADVSNLTNRLYLFPHKLDGDASPMWYTADPETLADTYTWQSQPIVESRTRVITVQELHLLVTPASTDAGSVTVTLSGFDADGAAVTPVVTTFTLAANINPQQIHKDVVTNFQATHITVKVVADANETSTPAPKIHKIALGTASRARVAKS